MSLCTNLVCPETKKAIWVGQRDYLYSAPENVRALAVWLHEHKNKPIFFVDDNSGLIEGIEDKDFTGIEP